MKKIFIILFLFLLPSSSYSQIRRGEKIVLDSIYSLHAALFYYNDESWSFKLDKTPFLFNNKVIIYNDLLNGIGNKIIDTIYYVSDTDNINRFCINDSNIISIQNYYINSFFKLFKPTLEYYNKTFTIDSTGFKKKKLTIFKPIELSNCIVGFRPLFDGVIFQGKVSLFLSSYKYFYFLNAIFNDTTQFSFKYNVNFFTPLADPYSDKRNRIIFQNVTFNQLFIIYNGEELVDFDDYNPFQIYTIDESEKIYPLSNIKFQFSTFNNMFIIHSSLLKNITFESSTFNYPLFLKDKRLDSTTFNNCSFNILIDLRGTNISDGSSLKNNFFKENCNIIIGPNDDISKLDLNNRALEKVFFIIDWGWSNSFYQYVYWDPESKNFSSAVFKPPEYFKDSIQSPLLNFSENNLEKVEFKLYKIKDYVGKTISNDDIFGSERQKIINWLNYQENQYEKLYYSRNSKLHYYWLCFLELTVNFGYNGELPFIKFCLTIIILFTVIFRLFYTIEINEYISTEKKDGTSTIMKNDFKTKKTFREWILNLLKFFNLDFIKSFFVSFSVFFTPKFPSWVFKYPKSFSWFIMADWSLGIFFIILFLYFIAGNYPVITKLIGL